LTYNREKSQPLVASDGRLAAEAKKKSMQLQAFGGLDAKKIGVICDTKRNI
jgi:hypothetical protein